MVEQDNFADRKIPWFNARRFAHECQGEIRRLSDLLGIANQQLKTLGALSVIELETKAAQIGAQIEMQRQQLVSERQAAEAELQAKSAKVDREIEQQRKKLDVDRQIVEVEIKEKKNHLESLQASIVLTEETALLQEAGIYEYRHPLTDVVAYEKELERIEVGIKAMAAKDGGAVTGATNWTVNGSTAEGRRMVRDTSKLMLRAFNAEADNLVRGLKPYKLDAAKERLRKVAETIERLGRTMTIRISSIYLSLRIEELELTADYLQKLAEQKEAERQEKERLKEERKAQQEIEKERQRLEKERQHYGNALEALVAKGDETAAARVREQLADVHRAIEDVDYRAANIRAGYVYLISNIGSFGEKMVKLGMTRRLDPMERIKELSDASVPFNFDVHAIFFSKDAVGIETTMHERLAGVRVNLVNRRREFFHATPQEVKEHLSELAGELLEFKETPEALEYRQGLRLRTPTDQQTLV